MKNTVIKSVNAQIAEELSSAYIYLGMAAYAESINLKGFANWFTVQAKEELTHAMGFYKHLVNRGEKIDLAAMPKPSTSYKSIVEAVAETLKHEKYITDKINKLFELATKEKDYPLASILKWYIDEQVEEEGNATELLDKTKMVGKNETTLYMLDKELATRVFIEEVIE
jgi:ferritin